MPRRRIADRRTAPPQPSSLEAPRDLRRDCATCAACLAEVRDPSRRRFRDPFVSCPECGPRFAIATRLPIERSHTTLASFPACPACEAERSTPDNRRHGHPLISCPACGPKLRLRRADGLPTAPDELAAGDEIDRAARLLQRGALIAVLGPGGYRIWCDATNTDAVEKMRLRQHRPGGTFPVLVRDLEVARRYAVISDEEEALLTDAARPAVLLRPRADVAPELAADIIGEAGLLALSLPATALEHLALDHVDHPIVRARGNVTTEPTHIDPRAAIEHLPSVADWILDHDLAVAHRLDDSFVRHVAGEARMIQRSGGYAPSWFSLDRLSPPLLAVGHPRESAFALGLGRRVFLAPPVGDLHVTGARDAWRDAVARMRRCLDIDPEFVVVDLDRRSASSILGRELAASDGLPTVEVQHHHALVAACLAQNDWTSDGPPVLGIALDDVGMGQDGELWGGEFLLTTYGEFERVASFEPVPLLGAEAALEEPWRSLYAHLTGERTWSDLLPLLEGTDLAEFLASKPRQRMDQLRLGGTRCPLASSCGSLLDAVATAVGIRWDRVTLPSQAARALEAAMGDDDVRAARDDERYPFPTRDANPEDPVLRLLTRDLWPVLLADLASGMPAARVVAKLHVSLAESIATTAQGLAEDRGIGTVALAGDCFQNGVLLHLVQDELRGRGLEVLSPHHAPPGYGGIALGQAAIASAATERAP